MEENIGRNVILSVGDFKLGVYVIVLLLNEKDLIFQSTSQSLKSSPSNVGSDLSSQILYTKT